MKRLSLPSLTKKAVRVFNRYIRLKYMLPSGAVECVTCNTRKPFEEIEAGHYHKSTYFHTKFDELNVHPQCVACNHFRGGNMAAYSLFLTRTYGNNILELLETKKNQPPVSSMQKREILNMIINVYEDKLKAIFNS